MHIHTPAAAVCRNVRTFKRVIAPLAARIEAASNDRDRIAGLLYDVRKGEVGRAQALAKLRKHFELATITFPPVPPPPAAP
jgi:hypothetical protein